MGVDAVSDANHVVSSYWRTRHPLLRFLCLHITLRCCDFLAQLIFCDHPSALRATASVELCSPRGEVPWSFIAREDPHSKCIKCLGFSHARDVVYRTSKCKICEDFRLITLRSRLEDCERESSIFPRCASSTSAAPREIAASRESTTWGSDVELEEMKSEQTGLALPPLRFGEPVAGLFPANPFTARPIRRQRAAC